MSTSHPSALLATLFGVALFPQVAASKDDLRTALVEALDQAREFSGSELNTQAPKFDAALGCLQIMARLDLTVLQGHLLLSFARQPDRPLADLAADLVMPLERINNTVAELFSRQLVQIPFGGAIKLTESGLNFATIIIACTALAEASNALRRMDAMRRAA